MKRKWIPAVLLLALAGGMGVYLSTQVSENTVYYYTVVEAQALAPDAQDGIRISGHVLAGSIQRDVENMKLSFRVKDPDGTSMPVNYSGPVPDIFNDDVEVVVEGSIVAGTFEANNLLAKCPSKYEKSGDPSDFHDVDIPGEWRSGESS